MGRSTMGSCFFQYHSRASASLATRDRQQSLPRLAWGFDFPHQGAKIVLTDSLRDDGATKLHTGLSINCHLKRSRSEESETVSRDLAENLLNLVSFSTLASCGKAELVSVIDATGAAPLPCLFSDTSARAGVVAGSLRVMRHDRFQEIFDCFQRSADQERLVLATSWLRKAINEQDAINKFVCYWTGIEVLRHLLRRDPRFMKTKKGDKWCGVQREMEDHGFGNFETIRGTRRHLFHGGKLDHAFIKRIRSGEEPLRKTLISCLGTLLGIADSTLTSLTSETPIGLPSQDWIVAKGTLTDMPVVPETVLKNYPHVVILESRQEFKVDAQGNLTCTASTTHRFESPKGGTFKVGEWEYWQR